MTDQLLNVLQNMKLLFTITGKYTYTFSQATVARIQRQVGIRCIRFVGSIVAPNLIL